MSDGGELPSQAVPTDLRRRASLPLAKVDTKTQIKFDAACMTHSALHLISLRAEAHLERERGREAGREGRREGGREREIEGGRERG